MWKIIYQLSIAAAGGLSRYFSDRSGMRYLVSSVTGRTAALDLRSKESLIVTLRFIQILVKELLTALGADQYHG